MLVTSSALITNQKGIDYMSNYTGKNFNCKCITCGKEFHRKPSAIKRRSGRMFCSKECSNKDKSKVAYEKMCEKVNEDFKEFLNREYHQNKKGTHEIALEVYGRRSMSPNILGWMERLDIETRDRSEAVSLQWVDNDERRQATSERAVENLGANSDGRKKLIEIMQTDEYKEKISQANSGENNGMYGITGELHHNWNPNKTMEDRKKTRKLPKYGSWRTAVFRRDKYTCQKCLDDRGGNLVAHHINSYNWDEKSRTEVSNGVTLCEDCHKEFHRIYGYGNNDFLQFGQYMYK